MSLVKRSVKGIGAIAIATVLGIIIGYLTRLVLARTIGPEGLGLFYSAFSLMMFFTLFANMGIGVAIVKYISEFSALKEKNNLDFTLFFSLSSRVILGGAVALIFASLGWYLENNFFKVPGSHYLVWIMAAVLFVSMMVRVQRNVFHGHQRMGLVGLSHLGEKTFFLIFVLAFAITGITVIYAGISLLLSMILVLLLSIIPMVKFTGTKYLTIPWNNKLSKKLLSFSMGAWFVGMGNLVLGYIDTLMLTIFVPLSEVGIYNIVLPTIMAAAFIGVSIKSAFLPMASELFASKNYVSISEGARLIEKYSLFLLIPVLLLFLAFPVTILGLLFGHEFQSGALALQILAVGMVFLTLHSINESLLYGMGKPKLLSGLIGVAALFNIVLNLILIPIYGIEGAAITTTLSYFLMLIGGRYLVKKQVNLHMPYTNLLKYAVSGGAFLLAVFLVKLFPLSFYPQAILALIFGFATYILVALMLKLVDVNEIKRITKQVLGKA